MFSAPAPIESPASAPPFAPVRVIDLAPASNLDGYLVDVPEFRSSVGPRIVLVVAFALLGAIVAALILFT